MTWDPTKHDVTFKTETLELYGDVLYNEMVELTLANRVENR